MKKKRPSLTTRLIVTMIGIVAGTVILCWFFNNTFLERYYIYNKQKELLNGYAKAPVEYQTKLFVQKELDIRGSRNATPANFRRVIEFARRGRFPIAKMLTKTYDFADAGRALADWDAAPGKVCRLAVKL